MVRCNADDFENELKQNVATISSNYLNVEQTFLAVLDKHVPYKNKKIRTSQVHKVTIKLFRTNSLVLAHSSAKKFYIEQLTEKSSTHDFHMASFSPCCHNWRACTCFCACICLSSQVFCLACCRLCVEQWLAFH